ncbi:MAG TPA: galactokinase [Chitinophagaceae bacterium]|nr:galactokinase [Chitinophagaceae bacterium]
MVDSKDGPILAAFQKRFQRQPEHIFFSPGRVNLIGEHIDYNGGKVMPCAISLGTYLAVSKNTDKKFRFHCLNFPETAELHLQNSYSKSGWAWFNYPLGIINYFITQGHSISGLDMLFYGDLPIGAGLSSSASIEVLTAFTLKELFQLNVPQIEIATLSKKVENEFIGVNCGIMDQFAVTFGQKNKAIMLNCDTLEYELLPFQTDDYALTIINTNKTRTLADSKYNERFAECGAALKALKKEIVANNLCDIGIETFKSARHLINDDVLQKRALHVISENSRVNDAKAALNERNLKRFGELMYASHQSLKDLYEVSGIELDTIVDFCKSYEHCVGARMTGAGFGGCAIALVKTDKVNDFAEKLSSYYKSKIGYDPTVFASAIGDGVRELQPSSV